MTLSLAQLAKVLSLVQSKKRSYETRIYEIEHGSFTPLIFSATGGMADEATAFYDCLASLLSSK